MDQLGHPLIVDGARLTRTQFVVKPRDTTVNEAPAPLAHRGIRGPKVFGYHAVGFTFGASQHDLGPLHERCRHRARARHRFQLQTFLRRQHELCHRARHRNTSYERYRNDASY